MYTDARRVDRLVEAVHDAAGDDDETVAAEQDRAPPFEFVLVVPPQGKYELQFVMVVPFETPRGKIVVHRYGFQPSQIQQLAGEVGCAAGTREQCGRGKAADAP